MLFPASLPRAVPQPRAPFDQGTLCPPRARYRRLLLGCPWFVFCLPNTAHGAGEMQSPLVGLEAGSARALPRVSPGPGRAQVTGNAALAPAAIDLVGCDLCRAQLVTAPGSAAATRADGQRGQPGWRVPWQLQCGSPAPSSIPSSCSGSGQVWWSCGHLRVTPLVLAAPPGPSTSPTLTLRLADLPLTHPVPCPNPGSPQPCPSPGSPSSSASPRPCTPSRRCSDVNHTYFNVLTF